MVLNARMIMPGLLLFLAWQLAACANAPTDAHPSESRTAFRSATAAVAVNIGRSPRILACPPSFSGEATALIGPEGGILELGPHRLRVPPQAVEKATLFRMTMPPGGRLILRQDVPGEAHPILRVPIALTISYSHCARQDRFQRAIGVIVLDDWRVAELPSDIVEHDESASTFTIEVRRLSTFAVAY